MQVVFMCHRMNSQQYCSLGNIHVLLDGSVDSQWEMVRNEGRLQWCSYQIQFLLNADLQTASVYHSLLPLTILLQ